MKYITLDNTPIPALGLGTYRLTGNMAVDIVSDALAIGYRLIDTAQLYENEKEIGRAIRESNVSRDDIYLVTKVWPSNFQKNHFIPSVKESLHKLNTDYIDLLLIHWPHDSIPVRDYIPLLIETKTSGLTRNIGVSNFNIAQLKTTIDMGAPIVTNQVEFHPWINQRNLHAWMIEHHIPLTAYCPLAKGKMFNFKPLVNLSHQYSKTPAQIILRWMMQKNNILAIPSSSKKDRLQENYNVFDFEIDKEDMDLIDAWSSENHRYVSSYGGASWD